MPELSIWGMTIQDDDDFFAPFGRRMKGRVELIAGLSDGEAAMDFQKQDAPLPDSRTLISMVGVRHVLRSVHEQLWVPARTGRSHGIIRWPRSCTVTLP